MARRHPTYLVISGIDGAGKTTVIAVLRDRLEAAGLKTHYAWMRYSHYLVRPVHLLCRLLGLSRRHSTPRGPVWRHEFYRCRLFCRLYVVLTWLDTWIGRLMLAFAVRAARPEVVICDRWIDDILIDLIVDTRMRDLRSNHWRRRFLRVMPPGSRRYCIMRDTALVKAAREDFCQAFGFRMLLYRWLGRQSDVIMIDNNGTIDEAVAQVLRPLTIEPSARRRALDRGVGSRRE